MGGTPIWLIMSRTMNTSGCTERMTPSLQTSLPGPVIVKPR